jgi:hypothetical protein
LGPLAIAPFPIPSGHRRRSPAPWFPQIVACGFPAPRLVHSFHCYLTEIGSLHNIKVKADRVPEGFRVFESEYGIDFYCASCDVPVEP